MDAKKVEILLEAVENGSMMGIAGQNGYTPSGLSHLLRRLEAELGVQLVERTNRGIALSENGQAPAAVSAWLCRKLRDAGARGSAFAERDGSNAAAWGLREHRKKLDAVAAACFRQSVSTNPGGTGGSQQAGVVSRDERGQTASDLCV